METTIEINPNNQLVCKYCLQNENETNSKFVNPCLCTNPVCIACLKHQIGLTQTLICEICKGSIVITPEMDIDTSETSINNNISETSIDNNISGTSIDNNASENFIPSTNMGWIKLMIIHFFVCFYVIIVVLLILFLTNTIK